METPSRRQDHSCDQCRRGKRRCNAPKVRNARPFSCSNCNKHRKECTFHWLSSRQEHRKRHQNRLAAVNSREPETHTRSNAAAGDTTEPLPDLQGHANTRSDGITSSDSPIAQLLNEATRLDDWRSPRMHDVPENPYESPSSQEKFSISTPNSSNQAGGTFRCPERPSRHITAGKARNLRSPHPRPFCTASNRAASEYTRSMIVQNMIRVYHDSMENALSFWLTERSCPYSEPASKAITEGPTNEWGPNWSNRICARICQLDQAAGSIRGRALSATEDQTAARVLHLSIMAFASQWSQKNHDGTGQHVFSDVADEERPLRASIWSQARHALETSTRIPSFRIVFANILFSLTQRPLSEIQDLGFNELMEQDDGHVFLETAVRQIFSFRYKLAHLCRTSQNPKNEARNPRDQSATGRPAILDFEKEESSRRAQLDPMLSSQQHRDTFSLLFWLGVMFDTQTAAMYQRPPVVSDEDSQIISGLPSKPRPTVDARSQVFDLDGFSLSAKDDCKEGQNIWGDMLLRSSLAHQHGIEIPNLSCLFERAAETFTDAAPVKILLWRRVTQLQTSIYRQAGPERLEEDIQRALAVYQHWNETYNKFILECVANHAMLPPRIQSWYVVLAAHWHLGALLLADIIQEIDQAYLSVKGNRDSRNAINFAWTLRKDNACAVAMLAHCSLHKQEPGQPDQFHDRVNRAAFLTEPFTALLIYAFEKSAQFSLENLDASQTLACCGTGGSADQFLEHCQVCIDALQCLGRKSDMASIVARSLSKRLKIKLDSQWSKQVIFGSNFLERESTCWPPDLFIGLPDGMDSDYWISRVPGPSY